MRALSAFVFAFAIVNFMISTSGLKVQVFPESDAVKRWMRLKLESTLKDNLLFQGLDPEQMSSIIVAMKKVPVKIDEEIITQGAYGDFFYVIITGIFEVFIKDADGKESLVRTYNNGGSFGELALMYSQPRSATVKAKTAGSVFALDRKLFLKIVIKSAHTRRKIHQELLRRVSLFEDPNIYANTFIKGNRKVYLSSR
ncbi:hypothetical protein GE061_004317 [Apolygus lucorum]|uniref:Cyclic nucleotide-binding domain-containing protein n=1 Tax=Apolygus lucorum TaxID=248454 RepID=A0A8S9X0R2_APOLU|nr:hypothetical protein GE061_004317 [Apolygus lucorum]